MPIFDLALWNFENLGSRLPCWESAPNQAGRLICLASRNSSAEDVLSVFRDRPECVLQLQQLVAWEVHLGAKPESLQRLSTKLGLSLDSFVFWMTISSKSKTFLADVPKSCCFTCRKKRRTSKRCCSTAGCWTPMGLRWGCSKSEPPFHLWQVIGWEIPKKLEAINIF